MEWEDRNTFDRLVFEPRKSFRDSQGVLQQGGNYNAWQGFAIEPLDTPEARAAAEVIKRHLLEVICDDDLTKYTWLMDWLACAIQHPEARLTIPVFKSEEGTGKGTFIDRVVMPIFGTHGLVLDSPDALTGRFNSHLGWACMISVNEAIWGGDKQREGKYKAMATDEYRALEQKFRDIITVKNHSKMIISTNNDWPAPIGDTDRRHAVFDVSSCRIGDQDYFDALHAATDLGRRGLLHEWLEREFDMAEMRRKPVWSSEAETVAVMLSTDPLNSFLYAWLSSGTTLGWQNGSIADLVDENGDRADMQYELELSWDEDTTHNKQELYAAYRDYCKNTQIRGNNIEYGAFCRELMKCFGRQVTTVRPGGNKARVFAFGPIPALRKCFEKKYKTGITWPE